MPLRDRGVLIALIAAVAVAAMLIGGHRGLAVYTSSPSVGGNTFSTATLQPPSSLIATGGTSVALSWTATTSSYASGYNVLRGTTSGGPYSRIAQITPRTVTTYTDTPASATYYYVLQAFYQNWTSVNSNEASAAVSGIAFVNTIGTATRSSAGNSSITITVPAAGVAAGHSVIVGVTAGTFAGAVACSDTKGNSYAVDADVTASGRLFVCSAHNVAALTASDTITASYPGFSGLSTASANEFAGLLATPVDRSSTASGNNASPSSGSTATTAQARELVFGAIAHSSTPTFTPGAGYTLAGEVIGGSGSGQKTLSPEYQIVSSVGSYAATGTLSSGQQWQAVVVTYKGS